MSQSAGRPTPRRDELERAAEGLRGQGLSGWLAVSEGQYHGRGPLRLMMVRPLAGPENGSWEAAEAAFMAARKAASAP